ncbi:hypothetical protein M2140_000106 [Clostridiales Family XIII bacterium PM5-7]
MKIKLIAITMSIFIGSSAIIPLQNIRFAGATAVGNHVEGGKITTEFTFDNEEGGWWGVYGEFEVGAKYTLVYNNMGTADIYDDEIIDVIKHKTEK